MTDDDGNNREVVSIAAPGPSPAKKAKLEETARADSDAESECDFLGAAPAIFGSAPKAACDDGDEKKEPDASKKRKRPAVNKPTTFRSANSAPRAASSKPMNLTKQAAARHKEFGVTVGIVKSVEEALDKAGSNTLVKMMSFTGLVSLEKKLAARNTCELLRFYMDEQLAEAPVDFQTETAVEGKQLVDKLVELSPKLSAVKNLVRCLNPTQRDVQARERLLLQASINGMSQLGLVVPSIAIQQHLERVIDDTDFGIDCADVRAAACLLSATKPPAASEAEIGLWGLKGSDESIAKVQVALIVRCLQAPLAAAKKEQPDTQPDISDIPRYIIKVFLATVCFKTEAVKVEFQQLAHIFEPGACDDPQVLADCLAAIATNKKSPFYATLHLYCSDQVKECNTIAERLTKERSLASQLQALRDEVSNAALGDDSAALARWRVFRLRLSDLLVPCQHGPPMKQGIQVLVDEIDEATLKVPMGCQFRLDKTLRH